MISLKNDRLNYSYHFCQQCGACEAVCSKGAISLLDTPDGLKRILVDNNKCVKCQRCMKVCPANRCMPMAEDYEDSLKGKAYFYAWNKDDKIRHESSSGGATKTIIIESLKSGFVDGVFSLRKYDRYPSAVGEFYTKDNIPSYDELPNSVYHSIMACAELKKIHKVSRLMIVGTSCQLYALEQALKGKYDELVKVCIFCKQQKTLTSTNFLKKIIGAKDPNSDFEVSYRGKGWPGYVVINDKSVKWEIAAGLPFGRRLWTVPGCDICGDPFGMEVGADISVMDPWVIRKENEQGETLVTVHTEVGRKLIVETANLGWKEKSYQFVEPALGISDIWRKRMCVPFLKGEKVTPVVERAARAEMKQRRCLELLLCRLPRMPFLFYRILNRIVPKKRDNILKIKQ